MLDFVVFFVKIRSVLSNYQTYNVDKAQKIGSETEIGRSITDPQRISSHPVTVKSGWVKVNGPGKKNCQ